MKKFAAFITGSGEGCDYTIGCNKTFTVVEAENETIALNKILENHNQLNPEFDNDLWLDEIEIFEVINSWKFSNLAEKADKLYQIYKQNQKEAQEQLEFARLKQKYDKGDK